MKSNCSCPACNSKKINTIPVGSYGNNHSTILKEIYDAKCLECGHEFMVVDVYKKMDSKVEEYEEDV